MEIERCSAVRRETRALVLTENRYAVAILENDALRYRVSRASETT